jgi:hypothetical protein
MEPENVPKGDPKEPILIDLTASRSTDKHVQSWQELSRLQVRTPIAHETSISVSLTPVFREIDRRNRTETGLEKHSRERVKWKKITCNSKIPSKNWRSKKAPPV